MPFLSSALFWGIVLILVGLSVILRKVLDIRIPVFQIIFGVMLIYLGVKVMTGRIPGPTEPDTVIFSERTIKPEENIEKEYSIIFGKGIIDLRNILVSTDKRSVIVHTIFGSSEIYLPADLSVEVRSSSAFGEAKLPEGSSVFFGERTWKSKSAQQSEPILLIKQNVVFGSSKIIIP